MKKLVLSIAAASLLSLSPLVYAGVSIDRNVDSATMIAGENSEVSKDQLPEAVKNAWDKSAYKSDETKKIYKVVDAGVTTYEFVVKTDNGEMTVEVDNTGKILSETAGS